MDSITFFYYFLCPQGSQCAVESSGHQWKSAWLWPSKHYPAICEYSYTFVSDFCTHVQNGDPPVSITIHSYSFVEYALCHVCRVWLLIIILLLYVGSLGCVCVCWRWDCPGPEVCPQSSSANTNSPWRRPSLHRNTGRRLQHTGVHLKHKPRPFTPSF